MRRCVNKVMLNTHKVASIASRVNPTALDLMDYLDSKRNRDGRVMLDDVIYKWSLESKYHYRSALPITISFYRVEVNNINQVVDTGIL